MNQFLFIIIITQCKKVEKKEVIKVKKKGLWKLFEGAR